LQNNPDALQWLEQINTKHIETDFEVYPENQEPLAIFLCMQTNWNISAGFSGVVFQGLNYSALESVLRLMQIPRKRWRSMFEDIRVLEMSAIPLLNQKP